MSENKNMKIALLLQCHKNPQQINMLIDAIKHPDITAFVHVDRKSDIASEIRIKENVMLLPENLRVDVQWAKISLVDAMLNLLQFAKENGPYDYYWFCSGQDFPLQSPEKIVSYLAENSKHDFVRLFESMNNGLGHGCNFDKRMELFFPDWILGKGFIRRVLKRLYIECTGGYDHTFFWAKRRPLTDIKFYFGSNWMCLTEKTIDWIFGYLNAHPEYHTFFAHSNCPDESFFQTLIMNSPFAESRMDYLHYIKWLKGKNSPEILKMEDLPDMLDSGKLMARKFDEEMDSKVINILYRQIK